MANSGKGEDSRTSASGGDADERPGTMATPEMTFSFGPFRLLPRQHLLLQDDNPVPLGSRAFEILVALVERAGELLDRNSLEARAWPGITVEESNLRAQITALRRVLAQGGTGANYVVAVRDGGTGLMRQSRDPPARRCGRKSLTRGITFPVASPD
jgi:DNA-binding winged helix-turn-helix (wHTH) protein